MALKAQQSDAKHFVIKCSEFNTAKLFAEFYLPEYQTLLNTLRQGRYPLRPLREVCTRIFDGPFGSDRKVDMYQESGIPYVRVKQVQHEGIDLSGLVYISQEKHEALIRSRVVPGNVLMTIAGSQLGKAAVFPNTFKEGNITGHIVGIEVKDEVNPYYLAVFINSRFGKEQVTRWSHRSTRRELNLHEVGQILVPLPPRPTQDFIAQIMKDTYAARRENLSEAEALILTMDTWVFQLINVSFSKVSSGIFFTIQAGIMKRKRWDVSYYKPSNPGLKNNLDWCTFEDYVVIEKKTFTPSRQSHIKHYYVGIQEMKNDPYLADEIAQIIQGDKINGLSQYFYGGDILLARLAPSLLNRKSVIVPESVSVGCGSPEFIVIRPKPGVDSRFLLWLVKGDFLLEQMLSKMRGATPSQMRLHSEDLLKLRVPKVSHNQQQIIGQEMHRRRIEARRLRVEAENIVSEAKARVERMILGEEEVA